MEQMHRNPKDGIYPSDVKCLLLNLHHNNIKYEHDGLSSTHTSIDTNNFVEFIYVILPDDSNNNNKTEDKHKENQTVSENIINCQLVSHLEEFTLLPEVQSAYSRRHSTETAVLKVFSDLVDAISNGKFALLSLLDLSAAFDTVDHIILLRRLEMSFGFRGAPLECLRSYLEGRSQSVVLNSYSTVSRPVTCGVPQGSVLGPLLFTLYTADIGKVIQQHRLSHHCYVDDNQVYAACTLSECTALKSRMIHCYRVDRRMDYKQQTRAQPTKVGVFVVRFASSHSPD